MDHLNIHYKITLDAVLTEADANVVGGETLEQAFERITKALSEDRRTLKLLNNEDRPVLEIPDGGDTPTARKPGCSTSPARPP